VSEDVLKNRRDVLNIYEGFHCIEKGTENVKPLKEGDG
jgi:hypothetical protein